MNPITATFDLQRIAYIVLALIIWTAGAFGAGYALKWERTAVATAKVEAKKEAAQGTVNAAVNASDAAAVKTLKAQLAAAAARAASLESQIKEASNAHPAPTDCRLPDVLRDALNGDLAAGPR